MDESNIWNTKTKFMVNHEGGNLNDNTKTFDDQQKVIKDSSTKYLNLLNYQNDIQRDTKEYLKQQSEDLYNTDYRIKLMI